MPRRYPPPGAAVHRRPGERRTQTPEEAIAELPPMSQQKPSSGDRTRFEYVARDIADLQRDVKELQEHLRGLSRENAALRLDLSTITARDDMQTHTLDELKQGQQRTQDTLDNFGATLTEIKTVMATQAAVEEERKARAQSAPHLSITAPVAGPPPGISTQGGWESLSTKARGGIIAGAAGAGGVSLPYVIEVLIKVLGGG